MIDYHEILDAKDAKHAERIEELEIVVRAALSYLQNQPKDDGHAELLVCALRGALAKRARD
jgi:hypothetical protein